MSIELKRIQIKSLFGEFDFDVPIEENTLILVGENGSGKSTLINIIYLILTSQWDRLRDLPFHSCVVTIGEQEYTIFKEQLPKNTYQKANKPLRYLERRLNEEHINSLLEELAENSSEYWSTREGEIRLRDLRNIYSSYSKPKSIAFEAFVELAQSNPLYVPEDKEDDDLGVKALSRLLSSNEEEQVLFLPTYRRIEKELSDVFPDLDSEDLSSPLYIRSSLFSQKSSYIELVEFGMKDVEEAFSSTLKDLDQKFRSALNQLTGSYLSDILQGKYNKVDASSLSTDEAVYTVDLMLPRIGEEILSEEDRSKLRELLSDIKKKQDLNVEKQISAHFLNSLLSIHKIQQEREQPIRQFVDLINKYLSNKEIIFDPASFELIIKRRNSKTSREVPLDNLSSGEKQIISLFSHVFLSGYQQYFVVIDEPELSISVPWQKNFLKDLKDTGKCSGLLAVTHSPFVFENSLSKYAHSINEFVQEI